MNTNEFYKELISEYSFDHEKIKKAAMGKSVRSDKKRSRLRTAFVSAAGVAAALAVTVGGVALTRMGNPVEVAPASSVSVEERFIMAMDAYNNADSNTEEVFLYVTFKENETPEDMRAILAKADGNGNIRVTEVYLSDGSAVSGSDNIAELFDSNEKNITAVKVYCPGNFLKILTRLDGVYLVETEESFKESEFSAIDTNNSYEYYPEYSDYETTVTPEPAPEPVPVPGDSTEPDEPVVE